MRKLAVFVLLLLFVCASGFAKSTRKSKRVRHLIEKVDLRLDSIIQSPVYETIHGRKYHRFGHGVLTYTPDTVAGVYLKEKKMVHFKSYNGDISFSGIDGKRRTYWRNLKQLQRTLREPW